MTTDRLPERCPSCGATELFPVYVGEEVNALCRLCLACWHERDGQIVAVDPATCPGCQYENICSEHRALAAEPGQVLG